MKVLIVLLTWFCAMMSQVKGQSKDVRGYDAEYGDSFRVTDSYIIGSGKMVRDTLWDGGDWNDTALKIIPLKIKDTINGSVEYDVGSVLIYFSKRDIMMEFAKYKNIAADSQELVKRIQNIKPNDTLRTGDSSFDDFHSLVNNLLSKGRVAIFTSDGHIKINQIGYRCTRFVTDADDIFYLPDKTQFFITPVASGILDDKTKEMFRFEDVK